MFSQIQKVIVALRSQRQDLKINGNVTGGSWKSLRLLKVFMNIFQLYLVLAK